MRTTLDVIDRARLRGAVRRQLLRRKRSHLAACLPRPDFELLRHDITFPLYVECGRPRIGLDDGLRRTAAWFDRCLAATPRAQPSARS
jgi:hypothetical protein